MDDELIGQMRDVTGDRIETCELCGGPLDEPATFTLEPGEAMRVCASCRARIDANELPVELDGEADDPVPVGI